MVLIWFLSYCDLKLLHFIVTAIMFCVCRQKHVYSTTMPTINQNGAGCNINKSSISALRYKDNKTKIMVTYIYIEITIYHLIHSIIKTLRKYLTTDSQCVELFAELS